MDNDVRPVTPAEVAAFLQDAGGEQLLSAWRRRVLGDPSIPVANRLTEIRLIDHMPALLRQLCLALEGQHQSPVAAETIGRLIWRGQDALDHASERFDEGYTLAAVLQELSHFRSACLDLLDEHGMSEDSNARHVLHAAIDQAMTVAAAEMERLARASLRASEERMRLLVDGATEYAIVMLDPIGIIETWNAGAQRLYGWERGEILSAHYESLFTPEDRAAQIPRLALERAATEQTIEEHGWRIRHDRKRFWADMTVTALRDREKTLRGFAMITRDRTRERAIEAALQAAQESLRSVVEHLPAAVSLKNAEGRYVVTNRAFEENLGLPRGGALERTAEEIMPPALLAEEQATDAKVRASGQPSTRERTIEGPSGPRVLLSTKFPIHAGGDRPALGCVDTDVTAQKAEQAALSRAVEIRDRFVAVLGHDLREPIHIVHMAAKLIEARGSIDHDVRALAVRIHKGADRMGRLVGDMLDYARGAMGERLPIQPRPIELARAVESAVEDLRLLDAAVEIRLEAPEPVPGVWDADRIAQLVTNLVGNAMHHGEHGAPVEVAVSALEGKACIRVTNRGEPIPREILPTIFQPFRRADTARKAKGLGLGLYIVEQIALAHGGSARVESSRERTTFEVLLPR